MYIEGTTDKKIHHSTRVHRSNAGHDEQGVVNILEMFQKKQTEILFA